MRVHKAGNSLHDGQLEHLEVPTQSQRNVDYVLDGVVSPFRESRPGQKSRYGAPLCCLVLHVVAGAATKNSSTLYLPPDDLRTRAGSTWRGGYGEA